jgi:hypothetical protein
MGQLVANNYKVARFVAGLDYADRVLTMVLTCLVRGALWGAILFAA